MEQNPTNKLIRSILQFIALAVLIMYAVFRISVPLINQDKVYLDQNDGYIIIGSLAIAIAIEVVKKIISKKADTF